MHHLAIIICNESPIFCHYPAPPSSDPSKSWYTDEIDCICPQLSVSLLHVSRLVSREHVCILYSENKFKICRGKYNSFVLLLWSSRAFETEKDKTVHAARRG